MSNEGRYYPGAIWSEQGPSWELYPRFVAFLTAYATQDYPPGLFTYLPKIESF